MEVNDDPEDFEPIFETIVKSSDPSELSSHFPTSGPQELSDRWIPARRLGAAVGVLSLSLLLIPGAIVYWIYADPDLGGYKWLVLLAPSFLICRAVLAWFWPPLEWKHRRYHADATGVEIKKGVLHRTVVTVPRTRIQHTEVAQGPIQRYFKLASFIMHTAGSSSQVIRLDGLPSELAYELRDFLLSEGHDQAEPHES